jgi:hypothetical protein
MPVVTTALLHCSQSAAVNRQLPPTRNSGGSNQIKECKHEFLTDRLYSQGRYSVADG